jgi:hypothetical protein
VGNYGAIADAGETVVMLLRDRMRDVPVADEQIALASPVDEYLRDDIRLTLFLYGVEGNGYPTNGAGPVPADKTPTRDPLQLDLKYLLTAHPTSGDGSTTSTAKTREEHTVLGRAMQILQDNAIVDPPDLQGSLAEGEETLRISVLSETTDTTTNLWNTFEGEPYRASVTYLVTPIEIESRVETPERRVEHIRIDEHLPNGDADE